MKSPPTTIIGPHAFMRSLALAAGALLAAPAGCLADTIYVSAMPDGNTDSVMKFSPEGVGSVFVNPGGFYPYGLAFDRAGNLYVASLAGIEKFTPDGVRSSFANRPDVRSPAGLAFDTAGNLYAVSGEPGTNGLTIDRFTPDGIHSVFASNIVDTEGLPAGLAFDSAGNLYVANSGFGTIDKFTPDGVHSVFANIGWPPTGLAFDSAGNLYAANCANGTIVKFTSAGVGSVFANTGLCAPYGLAFDSAGNLYVANNGCDGWVEMFTPGGIGTVFPTDPAVPYAMAVAIQPGLVVSVSLDVRQSGNDLLLSWPSGAVGFALQSTPDLNPPVTWTDATNVPAIAGTQFVVTNAISGGGRFFRLKK